MNKLVELAPTIYQIGATGVIFCTIVAFIYRLVRDYDNRKESMRKLEEEDIPYIFTALFQIAHKLDLELDPPPGYKTPRKESDGRNKTSERSRSKRNFLSLGLD